MKDTINVVPDVWYRLYFGLVMLFCALVAGGCLLTRFLPSFANYGDTYALGTVTLALAAIPIVYGLTLYWLIAKRSVALATLILSMLFSFVLLNGLMRTDGADGTWLYVGGWLLATLFVGMYGMQLVMGFILLTVVYVLLTSEFQIQSITRSSWALFIGSIGLSVTTYFLWRQIYVTDGDKRLTQLARALRSNQEQSILLIQSIADGVIVTNNDGKIALINQAAALLTQWSVNDATGIDVRLVVSVQDDKGNPIPAEENPFTKALTSAKRLNTTVLLAGRQGSKQTVTMVISPIATPEGSAGTIAVLHDVSEARAAEKQSAEFISTASHEMRTPVAAIEGYLSLALNDKVSTIDSRARGYLEKAHASTQHLGQLFQDLLTSAKAEDGRISNHPVVVEMGSFATQLVEDLRFSAQKKGLLVDFAIGSSTAIDATSDDGAPKKVITPLYYIYVDPDRLREVITNLFDNAVKYTDQGKISLGLTGNNEVAQLYIRDTGPGIPAEDIPHLFQKFYRVDNSATRTIGGTGLGLFICRKIIELYKGRIWVESQLGKGSSFFINLPRLDTQRAQSLQQTAATAPPPVAR